MPPPRRKLPHEQKGPYDLYDLSGDEEAAEKGDEDAELRLRTQNRINLTKRTNPAD